MALCIFNIIKKLTAKQVYYHSGPIFRTAIGQVSTEMRTYISSYIPKNYSGT